MLEVGDVLKTWALIEAPRAGVEIACKALADHRAAYLDYEGEVSGGRGTVARWDHGVFSIHRQSDTECSVELTGEKMAGVVTLHRNANPNGWTFILYEATNAI